MNTNNLDNPGIAPAVSNQLSKDIDEYCIITYDDGHRSHLGASLIGHECKRYLWYTFRWIKHNVHSGRLYRLFNRGHLEEDRIIKWLEGIGLTIWADDLINNRLLYCPESDTYLINTVGDITKSSWVDVSTETHHIARAKADGIKFPQYRISAVNGHFGGSLDGICRLPERFQIEDPILLEFKTSNVAGFKKLQKNGMIIEKPMHFAQTSTYGLVYGFKHVLYICVCKDTDDMYIEIVRLDHNLGQQMLMKAEGIIYSEDVPPRLSDNKTFWKCKFCDFKEVCHGTEVVNKNCRSCKFAKPSKDSKWFCDIAKNHILKEDIPKACGDYKSITGCF